MKTLLLTGATGFLGGAVLEKLLKENQAINYLLLV
ncbi:MAG: SDR family oxidoreductase, partial [Serratia liquefaciens]